MTSTVKLTVNPANGQIFTANENLGKDGKIYGFLRFEQQTLDFRSSVANVKVISALKSISLEAYEKAKTFLIEGMEIGGKIIITESLTEDIGFKVKRAGGDENSPVCTFNGKPIYRKTEYSDVEGETHTLIAHTNGEEIKAHNAMKVSASALN
jgi:hypothetical protein